MWRKRVKVIDSEGTRNSSSTRLEENINVFLEENYEINVLDIKMYNTDYLIFALLIYEEYVKP